MLFRSRINYDEHHHHEHHHHEHHHHVHRNLFDVNKIIDASVINERAKALAKRIFLRVALAESKVHNEELANVHFHEVGAVDSIVDIIGTAILITKIAPDKIYSSIVNDGHGDDVHGDDVHGDDVHGGEVRDHDDVDVPLNEHLHKYQ